MRENDGGRQFIDFVQRKREQQGYTMEQVCEGICSLATVYSMEKGKWKSDKLVRDSILGRLGVDVVDYEHYLNFKEYKRFEVRNSILQCIAYDEMEQAKELLKGYRDTYEKGNHLDEQFCLCMEAQILSRQGGQREDVSALLEKAAALTVPGLKQKPLDQFALSASELNLILEVEAYRKERGRTGQYRQIVDYIEKKQMDEIAKAKIYPKAVYFLCRSFLDERGGKAVSQELEKQRQLCECAIELLRNSGRMYYLWELLELEGCLAELLMECYIREGLQGSAAMLKEWRGIRDGWRQKLEAAYEEQGMSCREGMGFRYFYQETGCSCFNDVIKIRREMLGMSPQELCSGICDRKTLRRLEDENMQTQLAIVEGLLERLGLPVDYTRTNLITDSAEARELMRDVRRCLDHGLLDKVLGLLEQIKALVPMDNKFNQQAIENIDVLCRLEKGEFDGEEYYRKMRSVLELTLPYDIFLKEEKKYLTYTEQVCIQNLMKAIDKNSREYAICMRRFEEMYQPFAAKGQVATVAVMYEFIMCNIGSNWGNRGEYDRSDRYSEVILKNCLAYRRSEVIKSCFYNRWWNYDKRRSEGIPNHQLLDDREELEKCIAFANLVKDTERMQFYQGKLEKVEDRV